MQPAWRLAISNLSARRSRTALLVAVVAMSAALIAAVSCAMHSMQTSARKQVMSTVGLADITIKPSGRGSTLDKSILQQVRSWPETGEAIGKATTPISISIRLPWMAKTGEGIWDRTDRKFVYNAIANAYTDLSNDPPFTLAEGRMPSAKGEIVVDATLMIRMSPAGAAARTPLELPARRDGVREHPRGPAPTLPDRVTSASEAERLNLLVGPRVGDVLEVARMAMPQVDMSAALADPVKAAEMARAAGVSVAIGSLFQRPAKLTIVGVAVAPPFGGRPRAFMTVETLGDLTKDRSGLTEIGIVLREGADPASIVEQRTPELPDGLLLQTSTKVTSGLDRNIESSRLGFLLATVMAFLCAAFIITTGMSTGVTERLRELGVLRCIGADKSVLAWTQIAGGVIIGGTGAVVGVPLGVALAAILVQYLQRQVEINLHVPWWGLVMAGIGAVIAGLIGAAFPAWRAFRVSPLEALAARADAPRRRGVLLLLAIGIFFALVQIGVVTFTTDGQWRFWLYVFVGLPSLFAGFFALSVPFTVLVTRLLAGPISALVGLPPSLLGRTVRATPYRYGFTAGSMMMGLALMVGIWTQGGAIQRDWLGTLDFPDAFVTGLNLSPESQRIVNELPYVTSTCAITIQPVETDVFGVRALQKYRSMFLAFEPEAFFAMTNPTWVQGEKEYAIRRLNEGGAVIIAREFMVARGVSVGDWFTCRGLNGAEHKFEIVGVVTSPGLEVVSQFFSIGEDFADQSLHAVFGSRKDLKERFGSEAIHLIQIAFKPDVDDGEAVREIREKLAGTGIIDAGSGRALKEAIAEFVQSSLFAVSCIAIVAMFIAGFGVANLIVAGITARQFEFGVLRAVGADRGLITRLVLAEAVIIGIAASALGTWMGLQGVYAIQRIDEKLFGLVLTLRPPPTPILIGCAVTMVMTLGAAAPAVWRLSRRGPRELLGSIRG